MAKYIFEEVVNLYLEGKKQFQQVLNKLTKEEVDSFYAVLKSIKENSSKDVKIDSKFDTVFAKLIKNQTAYNNNYNFEDFKNAIESFMDFYSALSESMKEKIDVNKIDSKSLETIKSSIIDQLDVEQKSMKGTIETVISDLKTHYEEEYIDLGWYDTIEGRYRALIPLSFQASELIGCDSVNWCTTTDTKHWNSYTRDSYLVYMLKEEYLEEEYRFIAILINRSGNITELDNVDGPLHGSKKNRVQKVIESCSVVKDSYDLDPMSKLIKKDYVSALQEFFAGNIDAMQLILKTDNFFERENFSNLRSKDRDIFFSHNLDYFFNEIVPLGRDVTSSFLTDFLTDGFVEVYGSETIEYDEAIFLLNDESKKEISRLLSIDNIEDEDSVIEREDINFDELSIAFNDAFRVSMEAGYYKFYYNEIETWINKFGIIEEIENKFIKIKLDDSFVKLVLEYAIEDGNDEDNRYGSFDTAFGEFVSESLTPLRLNDTYVEHDEEVFNEFAVDNISNKLGAILIKR